MSGLKGFPKRAAFPNFPRVLSGKCSLLPGWLCSFLAIWVERAARRAALATYVTNIAASSLVTVAINHGWVTPR